MCSVSYRLESAELYLHHIKQKHFGFHELIIKKDNSKCLQSSPIMFPWSSCLHIALLLRIYLEIEGGKAQKESITI